MEKKPTQGLTMRKSSDGSCAYNSPNQLHPPGHGKKNAAKGYTGTTKPAKVS